MKRPFKEEHGDEGIVVAERNGAGGRNGHPPAAQVAKLEAQDNATLRRLLAERDAEIAALKRKLASYEQQAFAEGSSEAASHGGATVLQEVPRSPRAQGRAVQTDGPPEGSRAEPMEIDGSDEEDAAEVKLRPDFARVHSSPPPKKKPVDLSDVIELTDSEPDVAIVAASNTSTNGKRRKKNPEETKEEVAVKKSENHVLSESSRRKQRKLNHATETMQDEKPETKPRVTEIPLGLDSKRAVGPSGQWKSEPSKREEQLIQTLHPDDATLGHARDDSQSSIDTRESVVVKQLSNPKAEVKKEFLLKEEDLLQLVAPSALRAYPVSLPERQRSITVTREHLKGRFGGNTMETFPRPNARRIAQHGYDNFMCINLLWNPHGPQIPGHGGLFFETTVWPGDPWTANPKHSAVQVLFTRLAQGKWLYLGEYELSGATPLSAEQWEGMHEANRAIWPKEIAERNWGIPVRARVHLRRTLGREPTREEVEDAQGKFKNITVADIRAALDTGEESIQAWSMKCVGYNEEFQKDMIQLARGA